MAAEGGCSPSAAAGGAELPKLVPPGTTPWHTWGSSALLTVRSGAVGPANATVAASQLCRIQYHRPETWRFMFWGRLVGGDVDPAVTTSVHALFDVMIGVGRSVMDTQKAILGVPVNFNAFCQFRWNVPATVVPGSQNFNTKYLTRVRAPIHDDSLGAAAYYHEIDQFPAEDIQCRVRLVMSAGGAGIAVTAEVGAFFAPNVHVRPDWFSDDDDNVPQFAGGEVKGT